MMMLFTNNASSRLYAAIDAVTTSIRVQAGDGAKFPIPTGDGSNYFAVTIEDRRSGQIEICNCTARSGDILNVQRGQEGTLAQAFALGATVSNRLTAATMDFLAHAGATGPQGPQGEVGPVGPPGATGPQGQPGVDSNIPGPQGPAGQTGATGAPGPVGPTGAQGSTGQQGPQGSPGPLGPTGPTGPKGDQGPAGVGINMKGQVPNAAALPSTGNVAGDAYVTDDTDHLWVWTAEGYWADMGNVVGPEGPEGQPGPPGPTGPEGPLGPVGPQGVPGPDGPQGPAGTTDWNALTGKPSTFPPTLPIPWVDVSGKPSTFPPTLPIPWTGVSGTPATYPPTLPIAQSGITNLTTDLAAKANLNSPVFTGDPTAPTPATADNDTSIATTAFVKAQGYAPLASPTFTGDPKAPTPATADNDTSIATTQFVRAAMAAYAITDAPADGLVYGRKNNAWATVIGGASTSDNPPAAPLQNGQLWWETDTGNLHIYYNDGNSSQWVQLTGQLAGGSGGNIDKILSPSVDMWAGFKTSGNRFVINDKADGLGTDVMSVSETGVVKAAGYVSDVADMWAGFKSPGLFVVNDSIDGFGTDLLTVDGNIGLTTVDSLRALSLIEGYNTGFSFNLYNDGQWKRRVANGGALIDCTAAGVIEIYGVGTGAAGTVAAIGAAATFQYGGTNRFYGSQQINGPVNVVNSYLSADARGTSTHALSATAGSNAAGLLAYATAQTIYGYVAAFVASSGTWCYYGSGSSGYLVGGTWQTSSDERLKEDFEPIDPATSLAAVKAVPVYSYLWKTDKFTQPEKPQPRIGGWKAQEMRGPVPLAITERSLAKTDIIPRAVMKGLDTMPEGKAAEDLAAEPMTNLGMDLQTVVATLWAAVQALAAQVKDLQGEPT